MYNVSHKYKNVFDTIIDVHNGNNGNNGKYLKNNHIKLLE
jgi:hypothetical protein